MCRPAVKLSRVQDSITSFCLCLADCDYHSMVTMSSKLRLCLLAIRLQHVAVRASIMASMRKQVQCGTLPHQAR